MRQLRIKLNIILTFCGKNKTVFHLILSISLYLFFFYSFPMSKMKSTVSCHYYGALGKTGCCRIFNTKYLALISGIYTLVSIENKQTFFYLLFIWSKIIWDPWDSCQCKSITLCIKNENYNPFHGWILITFWLSKCYWNPMHIKFTFYDENLSRKKRFIKK